jgi:hypothetical protein
MPQALERAIGKRCVARKPGRGMKAKMSARRNPPPECTWAYPVVLEKVRWADLWRVQAKKEANPQKRELLLAKSGSAFLQAEEMAGRHGLDFDRLMAANGISR